MSGESSSSATKTCGLCNEKQSRYCCPRCEIFYCSLECYKSEKHLTCSESFYQDCVNDELANCEPDEESQRLMTEILKRMHTFDKTNLRNKSNDLDDEFVENMEGIDSDDGDEELDLNERILGLNLNDPDALWNALTTDERNDFEALVNEGDVGSIIPQWTPWWTYSKDVKLVQDVNEIDTKEEEALKKCPSFVDVPKLSSLTTVQPAPAVRYNIANVLASYAFIARYFNNELEPAESSTYLLNVCATLDSNANFECVKSAIHSVVQRCQQSELIETDEHSIEMMKADTFSILQGPSSEKIKYYCKAALSHVHSLLSQAKFSQKSPETNGDSKNSVFSRKFPDHKTEHLPKLDPNKVKKSIKKVEYFLAYLESSGEVSN